MPIDMFVPLLHYTPSSSKITGVNKKVLCMNGYLNGSQCRNFDNRVIMHRGGEISVESVLHSCVLLNVNKDVDSLSSQNSLYPELNPVPVYEISAPSPSTSSLLSSPSSGGRLAPPSTSHTSDPPTTMQQAEVLGPLGSFITNNALAKILITDPSLKASLEAAVRLGQKHPQGDPKQLLPSLSVYRLDQSIIENARQVEVENRADMQYAKYVSCAADGFSIFLIGHFLIMVIVLPLRNKVLI
jgi:hypothetical protein